MIFTEPVEVRKSAEQIGNRNDMLVLHLLLTPDGLYPLVGRQTPESTLIHQVLGHDSVRYDFQLMAKVGWLGICRRASKAR